MCIGDVEPFVHGLWGAGEDRSIKPNNEAAATLLAENHRTKKSHIGQQLKESGNPSNAGIASDRPVSLSALPAP
jgi:hypothetical protein